MFPPTRSEFVDYYEGKDIPLDRKNRKSVISDRKAALAEAVSKQIAEDVRAEYLSANPVEARKINEAANRDVEANKKIVIASAIEKSVSEESSSVKGQRFLMREVLANIAGVEDYNNIPFEDLGTASKVIKEYIGNKFKAPILNTIKGRDDYIVSLKNIAKLGFLSPDSLIAAKLANFGAENIKDNNGNVVGYKTRDGKTVGIKGTESFIEAFNNGNLVEKSSRGGLFYSTKDPRYLEILKLAKENYKGEKNIGSIKQVPMKDQLKLNKGGSVNQQEFNRIREKYSSQVKENQKVVKQTIIDFHKMFKAGMNPFDMVRVIVGLFQATSGGVKVSYEFKGFEIGKYPEFREEHSPPVNQFIANLIKSVFTLNEEQLSNHIDAMYEDAGQYLISVQSDDAITAAGFKFRVPFNSQIGAGAGLSRIVSTPGIDINKIILNNGKTIAQEYGANLDGIQSNPNLEAAQKEVVKEKIEPTETVIASAVENKYNEPANNKLSNEQAIDALGDIFMANWNRDGNVNLNFVSDPTVIEKIPVSYTHLTLPTKRIV